MSDNTKQTNFRVAPETADRFREFCEQNGMTQAQGFDHIMQIVEMDKAKAAVPGRQTEIEEYEKAIKTINSIYLQSLDLFNNAEDIAKEQFIGQLESKDNSISNLQDRLKQAIEERNQALLECDKANERAEIAEKRAIEAETERDEIKQNAINMENLSNYFEEIQKSMNALQGSIDSKNNTISERGTVKSSNASKPKA